MFVLELYRLSRVAANGVLSLLAPVRASHRLPDDHMVRLAPAMARLHKQATTIAFVAVAVLTPLLTRYLYRLNERLQPSESEVLFTSRSAFPWIGCALTLSIILAHIPTRAFIWLRMRRDLQTRDRYEATRTGWNQRRGTLIVVTICALLALFFGALTLNHGVVVDTEGITFKPKLFVAVRRSYDQVVSVEVYDSYRVIDKDYQKPNLVVRFRDGRRLTLVSGSTWDPDCLHGIAALVSERAHVPIVYGKRRRS